MKKEKHGKTVINIQISTEFEPATPSICGSDTSFLSISTKKPQLLGNDFFSWSINALKGVQQASSFQVIFLGTLYVTPCALTL